MRVSVFKDSPYFDYRNFGCQVWCNGKLVDRVVEACEEAGWVIRDTDRIDRANECFFREILRGRVSIVNPRLLPVPARNRFTVEEVLEILNWLADRPRFVTVRSGSVEFMVDDMQAWEQVVTVRHNDVTTTHRIIGKPQKQRQPWQSKRKGRSK